MILPPHHLRFRIKICFASYNNITDIVIVIIQRFIVTAGLPDNHHHYCRGHRHRENKLCPPPAFYPPPLHLLFYFSQKLLFNLFFPACLHTTAIVTIEEHQANRTTSRYIYFLIHICTSLSLSLSCCLFKFSKGLKLDTTPAVHQQK